MRDSVSIWWVRLDLRLADNPALHAATARGAVVPAFVWSPEEETPWPPGAASNWWLHHSLAALDEELRATGSRLAIRRGAALDQLRRLIKETHATRVFWNRRYEPSCVARDRAVEEALRADGIEVATFDAALLRDPLSVLTQGGKPFQVYTPFWKRCLALPDPASPLPAPKVIVTPARRPAALALDALGLEPRIPWAEGFRAVWHPGEAGAGAALGRFLAQAFDAYSEQRDRPDTIGTSRLSPHLHFGEVSPRQIWHAVKATAAARGQPEARWRESRFLAELGWREFSHQLLCHFPHTPERPLRREFEAFPWRDDAARLRAWQKGRTGFPIVDAGMRELWTTGWMHNRVRMITASFLTKDLLLPWQIGARWFWDTLVDADLAQNTLGWQWASGCGADAAPYFRVFNPTAQGERYDPDGDYVRRWCPELAKLPAKWIHRTDQAPDSVLRAAGVELGRSYPRPIVDHAAARVAALRAFASIKTVK